MSLPPAGEWLRGLRRSSPPAVLGVLLLLLSIPAIQDLHALLKTLGIALLVLAAVIVLASAFSGPSADRAGPDEQRQVS